MWNFHDDCMKKICRPLLLYQDTDSFVYLIPRSCPYEMMQRAPEWGDFKGGEDLGWVANENPWKPGYFEYEFIHKGDKNDPLDGQMDVALEYAGSEAKVYGSGSRPSPAWIRTFAARAAHAMRLRGRYSTST